MKTKFCATCGIVQTDENSGRRKRKGHFHSQCNKCSAARVLKSKYDKLSDSRLEEMLAQHRRAAEQLETYLILKRGKQNAKM